MKVVEALVVDGGRCGRLVKGQGGDDSNGGAPVADDSWWRRNGCKRGWGWRMRERRKCERERKEEVVHGVVRQGLASLVAGGRAGRLGGWR